MKTADIARQRLYAQYLAGRTAETPAGVVRRLGAVQAQNYPGALWAVGLRTQGAAAEVVEEAIARRAVVRTWPMRGTLHLVPAEDAGWMLKLMTPRVLAGNARRLARQYGLDETVLAQGREALTRALEGGRRLARPAAYRVLEAAGIGAAGQRGLHILWWLAQEGLICFGPRDGKQPTFVLLDEWVPASRALGHEEALAELADRYFTGHGPATLQDFAWWTGLTTAHAKEGLELARGALESEEVDGLTYWLAPGTRAQSQLPAATHLLPPFDEYTVGYRERSAAVEGRAGDRPALGSLLLGPTLLIDGRIVGTWKRSVQKGRAVIAAQPFETLDDGQRQAFAEAAEKYGSFFGLPVVLG